MRIRPGREADAVAVAALWTEGYTGTGPEGRKTPYVEADYFEATADGRAFVAEGEEGRLDGIIVYRPLSSEAHAVAGQGEAEQARLVVAAVARGRGTGRALAELCIEQARAERASAIALWSRTHQVAAHRLYESLGYRRAPERDSADADGTRLVFVRTLS
ncbi:MAG TPA: GNAT family N-acetyltransferase [Solirubrobacterales bacterium]|nr:GNAT family N-acetyltransferase [Solirubrobacterales bacterium]